MAFKIKALEYGRVAQMNVGYLRVAAALWIVALVAGGHAESFPTRPTAGEMDEIVALGTECMLGVNERCWATQYSTNPVQYRVAPFTNTTFYLDQSLMSAMASKISSLVQYYADPATVYNGTTNITMLTFTGLLASLHLGDGTNFTCIPAIGTNAATYGDNPWRIYVANLQERYNVLNALKMFRASANENLWMRDNSSVWPISSSNWTTSITVNEAAFLAAHWTNTWNGFPNGMHQGSSWTAAEDGNGFANMSIAVMTGSVFGITSSNLSELTYTAEIYLKSFLTAFPSPTDYVVDGNGFTITTNTFSLLQTTILNGGERTIYYFPSIAGLPHLTAEPGISGWTGRGWEYSQEYLYILLDWQFNYCTEE